MRARYQPQPGEAERVEAVLAMYRPARSTSRPVSESALEWAREVVVATAPPTVPEAHRRMSAFALYVGFCEHSGYPLDRNALLSEDVINWYVDSCDQDGHPRTLKSRSTLASTLNRVRRFALNEPRPVSPRWNGDDEQAVAPYRSREIAQFFDKAAGITAPLGRLRVEAILNVSLGAGADSQDLAALRGSHVCKRHDGGVAVTLGADLPGVKARTVVVERRYEQAVWSLAESAGDRWVLANPEQPDRPVRVDNLIRNAWPKNASLRFPTPQRLRVTWLVGRLEAGVPAHLIAQCLGVRISVLDRYTQFLRPTAPALAEAWLRDGVL